jgi:hypothetical protein
MPQPRPVVGLNLERLSLKASEATYFDAPIAPAFAGFVFRWQNPDDR